tara:strand:- start:636 stop:1211 length:576 start_codon:yes stop_codon:yes gene_type:complete
MIFSMIEEEPSGIDTILSYLREEFQQRNNWSRYELQNFLTTSEVFSNVVQSNKIEHVTYFSQGERYAKVLDGLLFFHQIANAFGYDFGNFFGGNLKSAYNKFETLRLAGESEVIAQRDILRHLELGNHPYKSGIILVEEGFLIRDTDTSDCVYQPTEKGRDVFNRLVKPLYEKQFRQNVGRRELINMLNQI